MRVATRADIAKTPVTPWRSAHFRLCPQRDALRRHPAPAARELLRWSPVAEPEESEFDFDTIETTSSPVVSPASQPTAMEHNREQVERSGFLGTGLRAAVTGERLAAAVARKEVLSLVRALEESSQHPVGRALAAHAGPGPHTSLERRRIIAGRGVEAIDERGCQVSLQAGADGSIVLQRDGDTLAAFDLDEQLRPEASEAIDMLRRARMRVVLLSGDAEPRVSHVGRALSIEAHARLTPQEKVRRVGMLGDRTAMVGDGVNDAPALAIGRASFTLGDAAQLAKGIAHVTLLHADLRLVPFTLTLARRGRSLVQWLIGASTAYNVVFVTLAARGTLKPVWAGLSMLISSILAVGFAAASGGGALGENDGLELSESPT
jgi:P-type Cu+ transporter